MGKTLNVHQPGGPLVCRVVEGLVDGGDEPPGVAEDEEPDDGQRDPGDPALAASQHGSSRLALKRK